MNSDSIHDNKNDVEHNRHDITSCLEGKAGFVDLSSTITSARAVQDIACPECKYNFGCYFEVARGVVCRSAKIAHGECGFCATKGSSMYLTQLPERARAKVLVLLWLARLPSYFSTLKDNGDRLEMKLAPDHDCCTLCSWVILLLDL